MLPDGYHGRPREARTGLECMRGVTGTIDCWARCLDTRTAMPVRGRVAAVGSSGLGLSRASIGGTMWRTALEIALLVVGLLGAPTGTMHASGREVVLARLRGEVGPASARYLDRVVSEAEKRGAEAIIVEIDTPGGLEISMRQMVQRLLGAEIPVIAWVGPAGARAASAGTFIVMAADVAAMAPGTTIGAAHPIMVSGGTVMPVDPILLDKVTNDAAGYLRGLAAQRGRNADWAELAVRESAVLGAADALRDRVVDVEAVSVEDLLGQLDGRRVAGPWGTRSLQLHGATVVAVGQTIAEMVVEVVGQPAVAYVLCLLGLVMIAIEIVTPTVGAFGIAGTICLVAGLVGFDSLPVRWAGVALLALGVSLVLAELKAGGHGALAAVGVVAVAIGSWWLFPDSGPTVAGRSLRPPLWIMGSAVGLLASVSAIVIFLGTAATRRRVLPIVPASDEVGVAETDLVPTGTVHVRGESWSGRSTAGTIPKGAPIRVAGRDGLTILVAPPDGASRDAWPAADGSRARGEG